MKPNSFSEHTLDQMRPCRCGVCRKRMHFILMTICFGRHRDQLNKDRDLGKITCEKYQQDAQKLQVRVHGLMNAWVKN